MSTFHPGDEQNQYTEPAAAGEAPEEYASYADQSADAEHPADAVTDEHHFDVDGGAYYANESPADESYTVDGDPEHEYLAGAADAGHVEEDLAVAAPRRSYAPTVVRLVSGAVIIAAVAAAIGLAPARDDTTYRVVSESQRVDTPALPKAPAPPATSTTPPAVSGVPLADATQLTDAPAGVTPDGVPPDGTAPGATPGETATLPAVPGAALDADWKPDATCSVGWPAPGPDQQGGLSSLINIAPAAGPFMSEAFALGNVYQPVMSLGGPLLAEIEPVITANMSWISPLIDQAQGVGAIVLEAILPYYGPYRQQFLAAEGELAKHLAPVLQRWASSDAAVCFVAWQAQQIKQAKGGKVTTVSLSRSGTTVTYGPRTFRRAPLHR